MASGPYGIAGGWKELIDELNDQFATNLTDFSNEFKLKHGNNGMGGGPGQRPYKFGHFADKHGNLTSLNTPAKRGRFLIDAGERRWDATSLGLLEYAIKHSLTNSTPKQITFEPRVLVTATKARADIVDQNGAALTSQSAIDAASSYTITITCPPAIWP